MGFQGKPGRREILLWLNSFFYLWGMQHCPSPLHTLSSDSLSRQDFKAAIKAKTSLKRKQWCGWDIMCILANIFSTHHELGLSGKVTRFLVRNILEVVRNGGRETLRRCILGSASGAQEPNSLEKLEGKPPWGWEAAALKTLSGNMFGLPLRRASQVVLVVKSPPASAGDSERQVQSLGWEDPLEQEITTHVSTLAWKIPWTEEPDGLQSMGLQSQTHTIAKIILHHFLILQ